LGFGKPACYHVLLHLVSINKRQFGTLGFIGIFFLISFFPEFLIKEKLTSDDGQCSLLASFVVIKVIETVFAAYFYFPNVMHFYVKQLIVSIGN